ncbi:hypothetical protein GNF82_13600 [Clostridium perfringens]
MILQTDLNLIENFARLHVYYIRERSLLYNEVFNSTVDIERIVFGDNVSRTYEAGIQDLVTKVWDGSKNKRLILLADNLHGGLYKSSIQDLRFCSLHSEDITEEEKILNMFRTKLLITLLIDSITIKQAAEKTGVSESAIKQACQQDRLLNKRKVGTTWLVSETEVREYWEVRAL